MPPHPSQLIPSPFSPLPAVLKLNDDDKTQGPLLVQENVFIEASRPKYLENLHSEALEGLKMMQQEGTNQYKSLLNGWCPPVLQSDKLLTVTVLAETNNGVEFKDNESTIVSVASL